MKNFIFPVPGKYEPVITAGFDQPRPLSAPPEKRDHKHGAVDIAPGKEYKDGPVPLVAVERGTVYYYLATRKDIYTVWPAGESIPWERDVLPYEFQNYFYDLYGGVILLVGKSGMLHVYCHSFGAQLFNQPDRLIRWEWTEERKKDRFPIFATHNFRNPLKVKAGEKLACMGDAGFSTAKHLHYEIHPTTRWSRHDLRINPETLDWSYV